MADHKEILKTYNAWRRDEIGGKTLEDFGITPKMVGEAIDAVLGFVYWQAECLKKGFEYVRDSDDHYVVASPAEMVALLRDILGVEIRQKDSGDYGVSVAELESQVDGLFNTIHSLEGMREDAKRYRFLRNSHWPSSEVAVVSSPRVAVRLGHDCPSGERLDGMVDGAMKRSASHD